MDEEFEILIRKIKYSLTKEPNKIIKRQKLKGKNAVHLKLGYRSALNDVCWEMEKLKLKNGQNLKPKGEKSLNDA